eukprot:541251-Amorphochlora_amoeboformis.AAC.1
MQLTRLTVGEKLGISVLGEHEKVGQRVKNGESEYVGSVVGLRVGQVDGQALEGLAGSEMSVFSGILQAIIPVDGLSEVGLQVLGEHVEGLHVLGLRVERV